MEEINVNVLIYHALIPKFKTANQKCEHHLICVNWTSGLLSLTMDPIYLWCNNILKCKTTFQLQSAGKEHVVTTSRQHRPDYGFGYLVKLQCSSKFSHSDSCSPIYFQPVQSTVAVFQRFNLVRFLLLLWARSHSSDSPLLWLWWPNSSAHFIKVSSHCVRPSPVKATSQ